MEGMCENEDCTDDAEWTITKKKDGKDIETTDACGDHMKELLKDAAAKPVAGITYAVAPYEDPDDDEDDDDDDDSDEPEEEEEGDGE
jgi:hypothetical protein